VSTSGVRAIDRGLTRRENRKGAKGAKDAKGNFDWTIERLEARYNNTLRQNHASSIFSKLVRDRTRAVLKGLELGII
jgi:hypothetical protein